MFEFITSVQMFILMFGRIGVLATHAEFFFIIKNSIRFFYLSKKICGYIIYSQYMNFRLSISFKLDIL